LQRSQGIAAGTGNAVDFSALDRAFGDLARGPLAAHFDLDRARNVTYRRHAIGELGHLPSFDLLFQQKWVEAFGGYRNRILSRSESLKQPVTLFVGQSAGLGAVGGAHHDTGASQGRFASRNQQAPADVAGRDRGRSFGRGRRLLESEVVDEAPGDGSRLAVHQGRRERELERGLFRCFVEAVTHGLDRFRRGHLALGIECEPEFDVRF
jgi:hypothetical protein